MSVCLFAMQIFKSNKTTTTASSRYMNDAILRGIDGLEQLVIYDRSLQPAGNLPLSANNCVGTIFSSVVRAKNQLLVS